MMNASRHRMADWLEQAWLARYLDRDLDEAEVAWFEAYALDKPHLLDALDADEHVRTTVQAGSTRILADEDAGSVPASSGPLPVGARTPRGNIIWLAWAASFALGLGLGWFVFERDESTHFAEAIAAPPRTIYDTLRGELSAPREEPGDSASPIRLYEMPIPFGAHVVHAHAEVNGERIALPVPPVSADGYVTFALPAAWRGSGTLRLELGAEEESLSSVLDFAL